jgi:hypothetical protein
LALSKIDSDTDIAPSSLLMPSVSSLSSLFNDDLDEVDLSHPVLELHEVF